MRWVWFSVVAVLGTALDLFTKWIMFSRLEMGSENAYEVIPGIFYLELSTNKGAAFGLFPGQIAFFIIVSAIAISAMIYFVLNIIGLGLGPLTVGVLSDMLAPTAGDESLRWALFIIAQVAFVGAGFYLLAARHLRAEMAQSAARRKT